MRSALYGTRSPCIWQLISDGHQSFFLIVSLKMGIDMFIPKSPSPTFTTTLNFHLPIKQSCAKCGTLGFSPAGDMWLAMAPNKFFDGSNDLHGSNVNYRIMISFLASTMAMVPGWHFYTFKTYGIELAQLPEATQVTLNLRVSSF